jgi:hypothetical protein
VKIVHHTAVHGVGFYAAATGLIRQQAHGIAFQLHA